MSTSAISGLLCALMFIMPLHAQTAANAAANTHAAAANPTPAGQAPDEMTKKITDLVHAGKYAEAQKLTTGLLVAYPDDQRLLKAKALIEKLLAPAGLTSAAPDTTKPPQPLANTSTEPLIGMERVDYNALIVLAHQAQQTTDLPEQTKLLQQFMDQSSPFLQKHPMQMLLWQLRAASAISLNDPMAGYEAGEKLLAAGAADSNDSNLQGLLAQLKNRGWFDKNGVEEEESQMKYDWLLGTWSMSTNQWDGTLKDEFSRSGSVIESYLFTENGEKWASPWLRGTILDSGEIRWDVIWAKEGWKPVISWEFGSDKRMMKLVWHEHGIKKNWENIFRRIDSAH